MTPTNNFPHPPIPSFTNRGRLDSSHGEETRNWYHTQTNFVINCYTSHLSFLAPIHSSSLKLTYSPLKGQYLSSSPVKMLYKLSNLLDFFFFEYSLFHFSCDVPVHVILKINKFVGTSLVVRWLRLRVPNAGGMDPVSGWGTKTSHATGLSLKK